MVVSHASSSYASLSLTGVHSPTLSGSSQLDAFRPLLPPTILIASHELGGISTTISAYESLLLRGYDIDAMLVFREDYYANHSYLSRWCAERHIPLGVVPTPPPRLPDPEQDARDLDSYYASLSEDTQAPLQSVVEGLQRTHERRLAALDAAPRNTLDRVWWPFVQHGTVTREQDVMVIDSATGDFFNVYESQKQGQDMHAEPTAIAADPLTRPVLDGSASWWTQCLGHANPTLTLAAAQASGRFGHVLFPNATNLPALSLTTRLLDTVGKGWASRVFFSDDGSTGMEVALKMALRAYALRERLDQSDSVKLAVLGLSGSYHGDTIGAMDACEGSVYSEHIDWYQGRGYWFQAPTVKIERGRAVIRGQSRDQKTWSTTFADLNQVYDVERRLQEDDLAAVYRSDIEEGIRERYSRGDGIKFGALVLEPVCMGAGGMLFVDPLYQRVLIDVVRTNRELFPSSPGSADDSDSWSGLPVIFDEVFVGLRRLGRPTASTFLGESTKPDIACYAKILTGGLVPMSVTLASEAIFGVFWGQNKVDALLHGHSYTAHPIGCSVANKTLEILDDMDNRGVWNEAKDKWMNQDGLSPGMASVSGQKSGHVWSLWDANAVNKLSSLPNVEGVMALGAVLAVYLRAGDAGYESTAAASLLAGLRHGTPVSTGDSTASPGGQDFGIHARPLGNVVYFMSSLNSEPATLRAVENRLFTDLQGKVEGGQAQ